MNEIGAEVFRRLGTADIAWQAIGLLIAHHPSGPQFAEAVERHCDAWTTRLDLPQTPEAHAYQQGYLAAIAELRRLAAEAKKRSG